MTMAPFWPSTTHTGRGGATKGKIYQLASQGLPLGALHETNQVKHDYENLNCLTNNDVACDEYTSRNINNDDTISSDP